MPLPPGTPRIDPYDDGLALVLELAAPATKGDVDFARGLLKEWLRGYESPSEQLYRNAGTQGEVGARQLVLWADRIRDPDGHAGALEQ